MKTPTDLSGNWTPVKSAPPPAYTHHPLWGAVPLSSVDVDDLVGRIVKSTDDRNLLNHLEFITNKPKWVKYTPAVNKAFQALMSLGRKSSFIQSKAIEYAEAKTRTKYENLRQLETSLSDKYNELIRMGKHLEQVVRGLALKSFENHTQTIREYQDEYDQISQQHNESVKRFNALWNSFKEAYSSYEYEGDGFTLTTGEGLQDMRFVLPLNPINLSSVADVSMRDDASYREDQAYLQRKRDR